ncbi:MAG: malate dehydrogenase [Candidatus Wallbacteria bacterium]|nr:malate dehydrogenase [Candidatus Wallbacteria bacterium]MBI4865967.1 malate dehydrogenase [Candidatus Wallbacteria bacterium]
MKKVTVIGAGFVGATAAQRLAEKELADVVLIDVLEGIPAGKALDMVESAPVERFDAKVTGSTADYAPMEGSEVVIITAGIARKPGMSRDDLFKTNRDIVNGVCENVKKYAPNSVILMVTNPLDLMAYTAFKTTGFSSDRVIGMAGVLDSARFAAFVGMELGVSVKDISAMVLGGHGDTMVPMPRFTTVGGIPITELLPKETIDRISQRARDGGAEIVKLLKTGSAYYAPSSSVVAMAEAILLGKDRLLPASVYLRGEYGYEGFYLGVPAVIGAGGLKRVIQIKLNDEEKAGLDKSANAVKTQMAEVGLA